MTSMRKGLTRTRKMRNSCGVMRDEQPRTPRLLEPVGTPGEIGIGRPDCRKPEAGDGAKPGSWSVTVNPVARSEREKHGETCERNCVKAGKRVLPGMRGKGDE